MQQMRSLQGPPASDSKALGNGSLTAANRTGTYQPEPDGRYYTRANFFSIRNNSRNGGAPISEKYQTDADPVEQEVFDEMMQRRHRIGAVQAPAVPGERSRHQMIIDKQNN